MISLNVSLSIDGKDIELNEFVSDFLGGTLKGAASSLQRVNKDWKELVIKVIR